MFNFYEIYKIYRDKKLDCSKFNKDVSYITTGSGGSNSIIAIIKPHTNPPFVAKILPRENIPNRKKKDYRGKFEAKINKFLTDKFVLNEITPHIVGTYSYQTCDNLKTMIKHLMGKKINKCPTPDDLLSSKTFFDELSGYLCDTQDRMKIGLTQVYSDILVLEYCPITLDNVIHTHMKQIKKSKKPKDELDYFVDILRRCLFQIIFTLAVIKEKYPGFLHGDLFVRNILATEEYQKDQNSYVAYHFGSKTYYLPYNGLCLKISDFGNSLIDKKIVREIHDDLKAEMKYFRMNPHNKKEDLYNLLRDIYDGGNLGSSSITELSKKFKIKKNKLRPLTDLLDELIDIKKIDELHKHHKELLDHWWHIDGIKTLEKTIMTPKEILTRSSVFDIYTELPENATIVQHFNK